jgi:hypothetical protein
MGPVRKRLCSRQIEKAIADANHRPTVPSQMIRREHQAHCLQGRVRPKDCPRRCPHLRRRVVCLRLWPAASLPSSFSWQVRAGVFRNRSWEWPSQSFRWFMKGGQAFSAASACAKSARRSSTASSPIAKRTRPPLCGHPWVRMEETLYGAHRLMGPAQLQPSLNSFN